VERQGRESPEPDGILRTLLSKSIVHPITQLYSFRMREVGGTVCAVRDDLDIDPDTVHVG